MIIVETDSLRDKRRRLSDVVLDRDNRKESTWKNPET